MIPRWLATIVAAAAVGAAMAGGCGGRASTRGGDEAAIVDLTDPSLPPPTERFLKAEAHIAPGDHLEVRLLGFSELSGTFIVAPDGRVNLSLLGSVEVAGRTAEECDRELTAAFGAYFRSVDVSVNVNARAERNVYVLGEVARPGRYDFRTGARVLHALATAGGMTASARENSVMLLRREGDGMDHAYRLDFGRIHDQLSPPDIFLQPGDVVFVPRSRFRTATEFARELLDVLGRTATTTLVVDDIARRTRELRIGP